jgi:alkylhydroperoxidase family enzyme
LNIPASVAAAAEATRATLAAVEQQLGFTPAHLPGMQGSFEDPKRAAAAQVAKRVIEARGAVDENALAEVRAAGYSDKQVIEITAPAASSCSPTSSTT